MNVLWHWLRGKNVDKIYRIHFIHTAINMEDTIMKTVNDIFFHELRPTSSVY